MLAFWFRDLGVERMRKQTIHFRWHPGITSLSACGADLQMRFLKDLKITCIRKKVTCGNCKRTKEFRKIK